VTHETRSFFTTTLHGVMYMYLLNIHQNKLQTFFMYSARSNLRKFTSVSGQF